MTAPNGNPLVTVNKIGRGNVVFVALADYLGEDERLTPFVAHLLVHLVADATPVRVDGEVEYLVNRNLRGWVITLFNDNGVFKPQQGLPQVDPSASVQVRLSLRGAPVLSANEWTSDRVIAIQKQVNQSDSVTVNIAPGGIAVVELVTAR